MGDIEVAILQAALVQRRDDAIEECAKLVSSFRWNRPKRQLVAAIRALAATPAAPGAERALRAAYEVYAGSDGFIPQTAAEGYQQQIIKQMVDEIQKGLGQQHDRD